MQRTWLGRKRSWWWEGRREEAEIGRILWILSCVS